jgi:hypothetical protein
MRRSLMMFLAPAAVPAVTAAATEAAVPRLPAQQAMQPPPPAVAGAAARWPGGQAAALGFLARVIGSAVGFAALFTACWFNLRLLQVFL